MAIPAPNPMIPSKPIRPKSLPDMLAVDIRQRILVGELAEGSQLRQEALARYYDVSRMPVREALRQLEAEGLVEFFPHRGAVVSGLSLDEIREIFHLRMLLECDLLEQAIPRIGPEQIAEAREHCDAFDRLVLEGNDPGRWGELNWKLHSALYKASGRVRTLQIAQTLHNQADRYVRLQLLLTAGESRASRDHNGLIELAAAGRTEPAVELLRAHIERAEDDLIRFLESKHGAAGTT